MLTLHRHIGTKQTSELLLPRAALLDQKCSLVSLKLISPLYILASSCHPHLRYEYHTATKCTSQTHGYGSTLKGIEGSLEKFGFGTINATIISSRFTSIIFRLHRPILNPRSSFRDRASSCNIQSPSRCSEGRKD